MKQVEITLTLECRDDVPAHVIKWMGDNLAEHAMHEFNGDYDPYFGTTDLTVLAADSYEGPPLVGNVDVARLRVIDRARVSLTKLSVVEPPTTDPAA